jgi:hypothetical protein
MQERWHHKVFVRSQAFRINVGSTSINSPLLPPSPYQITIHLPTDNRNYNLKYRYGRKENREKRANVTFGP